MANKKNKIREYTLVLSKNNHPMLEEVGCRDWYGDTVWDNEIARMMRELFDMNRLAIERDYVVAFDPKRQIKGVFLVGQGSQTHCPIPAGNLFTFLLLIGATSFMEIHNHTDGSIQASEGDNHTTQGMQNGANLFDMLFLGSLIVGGKDFYVYGGAAEQRRIEQQKKEVDKKVAKTTEIIQDVRNQTQYILDEIAALKQGCEDAEDEVDIEHIFES